MFTFSFSFAQVVFLQTFFGFVWFKIDILGKRPHVTYQISGFHGRQQRPSLTSGGMWGGGKGALRGEWNDKGHQNELREHQGRQGHVLAGKTVAATNKFENLRARCQHSLLFHDNYLQTYPLLEKKVVNHRLYNK